MNRTVIRWLGIVALVMGGWAIGRAQASVPDFELRIDAPEGKTRVECVRGCQLAWIERMVPGTVKPDKATFEYGCGNSAGGRCQSGRVGGWIVK